MFTINDPTLQKDLKAGLVSQAELAKHLMNNYPVTVLCDALAEFILDSRNIKPIVISEEMFNAHFRIQGYRFENGQMVKETRGRGKKDDV